MSLKNILTVMQPDQLDGTPPPIPSEAAAKLKGAQLSSGRARATLESQTAALRVHRHTVLWPRSLPPVQSYHPTQC